MQKNAVCALAAAVVGLVSFVALQVNTATSSEKNLEKEKETDNLFGLQGYHGHTQNSWKNISAHESTESFKQREQQVIQQLAALMSSGSLELETAATLEMEILKGANKGQLQNEKCLSGSATSCGDRIKNPLCGSNGKTYANSCVFEVAKKCLFPHVYIVKEAACKHVPSELMKLSAIATDPRDAKTVDDQRLAAATYGRPNDSGEAESGDTEARRHLAAPPSSHSSGSSSHSSGSSSHSSSGSSPSGSHSSSHSSSGHSSSGHSSSSGSSHSSGSHSSGSCSSNSSGRSSSGSRQHAATTAPPLLCSNSKGACSETVSMTSLQLPPPPTATTPQPAQPAGHFTP